MILTNSPKITFNLSRLSLMLITLLFCSSSVRSTCSNLQYELSPCLESENFTRTAYIFGGREQKCTDYWKQKPHKNIPCQFECKAGEFLNIETDNYDYGCKKCPANTYSNGGGFQVNGFFGEWNQALQENSLFQIKSQIERNCYQYYARTWLDNEDCNPCQPTADGSSLLCGIASARDTSLAFEIVLRVNFAKNGKVDFLYRKDSTLEADEWVSGIVEFYVNDDLVYTDEDLNDESEVWKPFSYDFYRGMNEIVISYQKYNSEANKNLTLEIKSIRVTGTEFADTYCTQCSMGYSKPGSDRCTLCAKDFYFNPESGECLNCPTGTHSKEGSIATDAKQACKPLRNCTSDEIPKIYSATCSRNSAENTFQRSYQFSLADFKPETCIVDPAIDEAKQYTVPCGACEAGSYQSLKESGESTCEPCPPGEVAEIQDQSVCKKCPPGSYQQGGLYLSKFESFPSQFNFSTQCFDKLNSPCEESNGFIPQYETGLFAGATEKVESTIVLNIQLEIIKDKSKMYNDALFEMNYMLKYFDSKFFDEVVVYLDKKQINFENQDGSYLLTQPLYPGTHNIQIIFKKGSYGSVVTLQNFKILGTSQQNEGPIQCSHCPQGFFSQRWSSKVCDPCPIGFSSSADRQFCLACQLGEFTPTIGSPCLKCPKNSYTSDSRDYCIPEEHLMTVSRERDFENQPFVHHFGVFSSKKSYNSSYDSSSSNYRICEIQHAFCQHNFFGPTLSIQRGENDLRFRNQFYFSPTERGDFSKLSEIEFELSDEEKAAFNPNSFIIGLFDSKLVQHYSTAPIGDEDEECPPNLQAKNQREIKSLGTTLQSIEQFKEGFVLKYDLGDKCFYSMNQDIFTSEIRFLCDMDEDEGWPQFVPPMDYDDFCHVVFEWRSKQACRQCLVKEAHKVTTPCEWNNKRNISYISNNLCIVKDQSYLDEMFKKVSYQFDEKLLRKSLITSHHGQEDCLPIYDLAIALLIIGVSLMAWRYNKLRYQYYERANLLRNRDGRSSDIRVSQIENQVGDDQ